MQRLEAETLTLEESRHCLVFSLVKIDERDTAEEEDVAGTLPSAGDVAAAAAAT